MEFLFERIWTQKLRTMKTTYKYYFLLPLALTSLMMIMSNCSEDEEAVSNQIKDGDGNVYTTVTIGTQVWLKENLKTTRLSDGTVIPNVTDNAEWVNLTSPGYSWYDNNAANKNDYGALYNWYTVNTGKLCPNGFHVASLAEWNALSDFLGIDDAALKLKEAGTVHWTAPNAASNATGFTALPGGYRYNSVFSYLGSEGQWWTSTQHSENNANYIIMNNSDYVGHCDRWFNDGLSVRCIKE